MKLVPASHRGFYLATFMKNPTSSHAAGVVFAVCSLKSQQDLISKVSFRYRLKEKYHDHNCHFVHTKSLGDRCRVYGSEKAVPLVHLLVTEKLYLAQLPFLPPSVGCHVLATSNRGKVRSASARQGQIKISSSQRSSAASARPEDVTPVKPYGSSSHILDIDSPEQTMLSKMSPSSASSPLPSLHPDISLVAASKQGSPREERKEEVAASVFCPSFTIKPFRCLRVKVARPKQRTKLQVLPPPGPMLMERCPKAAGKNFLKP